MPTEYFLEETLTRQVVGMAQAAEYPEFASFRENALTFLCAFVYKTNEEGEAQPLKTDLVTVKRVSPADRVFMDADFKVYVDKSRWDDLDGDRQKAVLHRALMHIEVVKDAEGATKITGRKPDIREFAVTVERFGAYTEDLCTFRECLERSKIRPKARDRVGKRENREDGEEAVNNV